MNYIKRLLVRKKTKGKIGAFKEIEVLVGASLLPILDFLAGF